MTNPISPTFAEIFCTEKFFDNDFFKYYLTVKNTSIYHPPVITYRSRYAELTRYENNNMQKYLDRAIVHELCHAFRNFLNNNFAALKMTDHGMQVKSYVSIDDFETEMEVISIQNFILTSRNNPLLHPEHYQVSIDYFQSKCLIPISNNQIQDVLSMHAEHLRHIGIDGLQERFHDMIDRLESI